MLSLTACASPGVRVLGFDPVLAEDCPIPALVGTDNAALAAVAAARRDALHACNADKAALREWLSTIKESL